VILVLLVAADRGANAYAENAMASQFQSSVGLSGKPHVTIEGFPFLTQVIAGDFHKVDISATNETITAKSAGGGLLEIASLTATLQGMHPHGTNSATVDQLNANALITFSALGSVGGIPEGITLSADGPNQVTANIDLGPVSGTAHATVKKVGTNQINVHVTDFGGIPADVLGNLSDFTVTLPKLPAGLSIQSVSVTQQGVRIVITGQNVTLSQ
jgi:carbon monoxide dehydrogenase subunit G